MSASWDTELIKKAGEVNGTEARVLWHRHPAGGLSRWAPTVDLERDPRWGRNEEGYGEDPVLTGAMAGAYIVEAMHVIFSSSVILAKSQSNLSSIGSLAFQNEFCLSFSSMFLRLPLLH